MALYVTDLADLEFCKAYIFSRKLSLIRKTLIMMTLGKYILKKVVDVCECFEISWLSSLLLRNSVVVLHPMVGFSCLPLPSAWVLKALKEAGATSVPSSEELPGEGKYVMHTKKNKNAETTI